MAANSTPILRTNPMGSYLLEYTLKEVVPRVSRAPLPISNAREQNKTDISKLAERARRGSVVIFAVFLCRENDVFLFNFIAFSPFS
jgi:hypothetical protein